MTLVDSNCQCQKSNGAAYGLTKTDYMIYVTNPKWTLCMCNFVLLHTCGSCWNLSSISSLWRAPQETPRPSDTHPIASIMYLQSAKVVRIYGSAGDLDTRGF